MDSKFDFEQLADHDLYHLRHGRGALIVAIQREDVATRRAAWERRQEDLQREAIAAQKPLRQKIRDLEGMRRYSGSCEEIELHNAPIEKEIKALRDEISALSYSRIPFFTGLQVALFYTHDMPRRGDMPARFDKVTSISECEGRVEIGLEFFDRSIRDRIDHLKIGMHDLKQAWAIQGRVTRIVPVQHVTLEIIGRNCARKDFARNRYAGQVFEFQV